jgi:hypothetical protein
MPGENPSGWTNIASSLPAICMMLVTTISYIDRNTTLFRNWPWRIFMEAVNQPIHCPRSFPQFRDFLAPRATTLNSAPSIDRGIVTFGRNIRNVGLPVLFPRELRSAGGSYLFSYV